MAAPDGRFASDPDDAATYHRLRTLTLREREVLLLLIAHPDSTNAELATELCVTERTVKKHLSSLFVKLRQRNRTGLVAWAAKTVGGEPLLVSRGWNRDRG
jgi:DNA-binding CsgD family transcriptional regulator